MIRGRRKDGEITPRNSYGTHRGFEAELFLAVDTLRKTLEPSDSTHVARGLIFLQHLSHAFEATLAEHISWIPKEARGSHLQANATHPPIGKPVRVLRAPLLQPGAPVSEHSTSGLAA
jgi:hypothetical protein